MCAVVWRLLLVDLEDVLWNEVSKVSVRQTMFVLNEEGARLPNYVMNREGLIHSASEDLPQGGSRSRLTPGRVSVSNAMLEHLPIALKPISRRLRERQLFD